ncbi:MAG: STAS domain-containing protein [Planctomycetota bacterium]
MQPDAFELDQTGPMVTAHFAGPEVSHETMLEVLEHCKDKMRYDAARCFLFDMEEVSFLASACIGTLVELLREVEPSRGRIALAGCNDNVAFLFKVTKLDDIFKLFDDLDEALDELKEDLR